MWQLAIMMIAGLIAVSAWPVLAEAQTVESTATYDIITNQDGTKTWTGYKVPRLQDDFGSWKNYVITEDQNFIQVKTNWANTLAFDKVNCSYMVYDSGNIDSAPLLPAVSWTAKSAINGTDTWSPMSVNNQACSVNVSQGNNQVVITATKSQDKTEQYVISINNATGIQTFGTRTVLDQKITHTIEITDRIKETIEIYNSAPNTKLGATETINNPNITLNGQHLNLAASAGQFFDRNWIEANQAEIFQVATELNYDFDIGFASLWGIKVNNNNSVSLDYNNSPGATNRLVIDPTYTNTASISGSNVSFTLSYPTLTNAVVSSGNIDGTALTGSQVADLQSNINTASATWTTTAQTTMPPTNSFDFSSSTGWTQIGTNTQISGGTVNINNPAGNGDYVVYDLNSISGDFLLYFDWKVNSGNSPRGNGENVYLSSANELFWASSSASKAGFAMYNGYTYLLGWQSGGYIGYGIGNSMTFNNDTWYYAKLMRSGSTYSLSFYTDSALTSQYGTTLSFSGTANNPFRYLIVGAHADEWNKNADVDNIKFYNGVTSTAATSNTLSLTYTTETVPGGPTSVSGTSSINNQVAVSWSAPADNGGSTITDYVIQHSTDSTNWTTFADGTSASTSATVTGLTSNTSYYFRVAAVNSVGTGSYSSSSAAVLVRPSTPEAPTGLTATVVSTSQIDLAWSQPADNGGATITDYIIQYSTDNITYSTVTDGTSSALSASVTGLSSNTLYYFKVAAVNSFGTGSYSLSTSKPTLPNAPTGLTGTTVSNTSISLSWTAPSGTATSDYEIQYSLDNITFNTITDGVSTSTSVTLTGLTGNQMYYFKVAAINSGGTGAFSAVAQKQTAPGAPTGLTATVLTSSSVSLSWSAPTGGNQAITDYQIQYSSDGGATWTIFADGTSASTSATITGLTGNTSYNFRVAAYNAANVAGPTSGTASATTYTSGAVTVNLTKELAGATTKLTWSASYSGTPVPTFSYTVKDGATTIATLSGTTYYYAHPDSSSHTLQVIASNSTHWDNPSGSGSITSSASYDPNFGTDALSYNTTRTNTAMNLLVNRDQQTLWNLQCNYKTGSEVLAKLPGVWHNQTAVWFYNQTYAVSNSTSVYIECYDAANLVLNVVGFNTNRVIGGINLLNDTFDSWLGVPVALIFVLFVAGMFSGRTAPTGILLILAMIGVMGFIGLLTISNTIWAFVLLAGTLGIFIGKRFL